MFIFSMSMLLLAGIFIASKTLIVVEERENVLKETFGKAQGVLEPGLHFMVPFIDKAAYRQEMREQAIDVPPQSCITKDNIQVEVDGIVYLKVINAYKASYKIGDYRLASINLAQTTMRSEIGKLTLDETFSGREAMNDNIVKEVDKASDPWGIKVIRYEIMNISPSYQVIDTMEKQMEAERQKRAEITASEGAKEARINISEGQRKQAINLSEGERQKRINEAMGRAEEIRLMAEASALGMQAVAEAIKSPGGQMAVELQLVEQYVEDFGDIIAQADISVVPEKLANIQGFFQGMSETSSKMSDN